MREEHLWQVQPKLTRRAYFLDPSSRFSTSRIARPPLYLIAPWLLCAGVLLLVSSVIALARQVEPLADPFASYTALFPGRPMSQYYSCEYGFAEDLCSSAPARGPFSLISVILDQGMVYEADFTVRKGALTVGDLALLWGRPHVRVRERSVTLTWPTRGIFAAAWAENGQFDYFLPVHRITFGQVPERPD